MIGGMHVVVRCPGVRPIRVLLSTQKNRTLVFAAMPVPVTVWPTAIAPLALARVTVT